MYSQVKRYIITHKLFQAGDKIVVAVSGGPDSMCLLHILMRLRADWDLTLIAAHLHHGLRLQADQDLELVHKQCLAWGVPLETKRLDIAQLAGREKRSLEEMGRICRYTFFGEIMQKHQANFIATAHHQEDNAESVLLHLLRGSGTQGLRGILPLNNHLVRPLLGVKKAHILDYLHHNQVPYRFDDSNADVGFTRNRIRHELIPLLEDVYNPQLIRSLNQLAEIIRLEDDWLQELTRQLWKEVVTGNDDGLTLYLPAFCQAHPAAQRRLVMAVCERLTGKPGWEKKDIDSIIRLGRSPGSSRYLGLKQGLMVYKVYEQLCFTTRRRGHAPFSYALTVPGEVFITETGERVSCTVLHSADPRGHSGVTIVDGEKLDMPVFLRSRKPGDRFIPPGSSHSIKLKEYYINRKIPWQERERIPLLVSAQEKIYALIGQEVSEEARVSSHSRYIVAIKREKLNS
jgi:tRNA(Ile)-lysidine synthase